jgi:hypothetical protein
MTSYDPEWRADGRPDKRRYPRHLIVLFWLSLIVCLISVIGIIVATFNVDLKISSYFILLFTIGLGTIAWIARKSENTPIR